MVSYCKSCCIAATREVLHELILSTLDDLFTDM